MHLISNFLSIVGKYISTFNPTENHWKKAKMHRNERKPSDGSSITSTVYTKLGFYFRIMEVLLSIIVCWTASWWRFFFILTPKFFAIFFNMECPKYTPIPRKNCSSSKKTWKGPARKSWRGQNLYWIKKCTALYSCGHFHVFLKTLYYLRYIRLEMEK